MKEFYKATALYLAEQVNTLLESEKVMEDFYKIMYAGLPFDRTEHWAHVFEVLLNEAWFEKGPVVKMNPTPMDKLQIIRHLHPLLDYNLFTQVLLNLQGYTGMFYMTGEASKEIERLKAEWPKEFNLDPFAPKAKMVKQAEAIFEEQKRFNEVISTLRALRIITQFTPQISFRVSPKGSTPAFADSRNISMIGLGGDKYLKTLPTLKPFYVTWNQVPAMAQYIGLNTPPGAAVPQATFEAEGIPYKFHSKSGGHMIQEVLFARKLMYDMFKGVDTTKETCIMIPRVASILIVADVAGESIRSTFALLQEKYPMLQLIEGQRG